MANSSPPPSAVPWMAQTTGLGQSSMRRSRACTRCERSMETSRFGIVPKTLILAPAMNVLPAPMSTMALAAGSAAAGAQGVYGRIVYGDYGNVILDGVLDEFWHGIAIRSIMALAGGDAATRRRGAGAISRGDRKSTRLKSSHLGI